MINRNKQFKRIIAAVLAITVLNQAIFPSVALALTSGPSQPEVEAFQPVGTTDMVDLFTGDFNYNIPLCDVDGYPINLSYQSNPRMEDEASWVGLGWSLNPGVINREVRGFPDDFRNEQIIKETNIRNEVTVGVGASPGLEFFGLSQRAFDISGGIHYNTYRGFGTSLNIAPSIMLGKPNSLYSTNVGLGVSLNSNSGLDLSANVGLGLPTSLRLLNNINLSANYNSRQGLKYINYGSNLMWMKLLRLNPRFGGTINFGQFTYFPVSPMPIHNSSYSFQGKLGSAFYGAFPHGAVRGYFTEQSLRDNVMEQRAYGYLHLEEAVEDDLALMDYNTDREMIQEDMPNLPMAYGTYDLFTISGQGIGGQFRATRNDVGILRQRQFINNSVSGDGGGEFGVGPLSFHNGLDVNIGTSNSTAGMWHRNNKAKDVFPFTKQDRLYESVFFKGSGEKVATNSSFLNKIGGIKPVLNEITKRGATITAQPVFITQQNKIDETSIAFRNRLERNDREVRNQIFSYLTNQEAQNAGLDRKIKSYSINQLIYSDCLSNPIDNEFTRTVDFPAHHIGEIKITQTDGSRYVYGIPAYNNTQREVAFSIDAPDMETLQLDSDKYTLANYQLGDNSVNNSRGREHFFDATEIPEYAHSYLLTAVLSPDYVDITGDGITDDDLGNAVKFNYTRITGNQGDDLDYKWRIPFQAGWARYMEGNRSDGRDDKASYLYGEKEIWYLHSIESRTMVAQFYLSDRLDGLGVVGEDGGKSSQIKLKKLDKISLFSKSELKSNPLNPIPIKNIHFEYNYKLCEGIPNHENYRVNETPEPNDGIEEGKLTLEKVYFTYGLNEHGKLNPYKFSYHEEHAENNPNYAMGHVDRWGTYNVNGNDLPPNHEFPYANQNQTQANQNAGVWNLTQITLPSGGKINVEYEADDYAFVQDKRAGQMTMIHGFTNEVGGTISNELYTSENDVNQYIVIDNVIGTTPEEVKKLYLEDVEKMYFKCLANVNGEGAWEYVKGYLEYDKAGVTVDVTGKLFIPIKTINIRGGVAHPIAYASWQKMRLELPQLAYPGYEADDPIEATIEFVLGAGRALGGLLKGFSRYAIDKNWGKKIDTNNRAFVRLANPNFNKYGGGSRVKSIKISDEWNIVNGLANEYGQNYAYKTKKIVNGDEIMISSGVAAYEPLIGGEENMMRQPLPYKVERVLAPDDHFYTETPIGESLFPAPVVGYSEVTIRNLEYTGVEGIGKTIHKFYTAKDFPVQVDFTEKKPQRVKPDPLLNLIRFNSTDFLTVSQGFVVEVNDMHGKLKSVQSFDKDHSLLNSTTYNYKVDNVNGLTQQLDNKVTAINDDGSIVNGLELGLDVDIWHEMHEENNNTLGAGAELNLDGFIIPFPLPLPPVVVPTVFPSVQFETTRLQTAVTTKFIKRFGILDEVVVMDKGSTITTENILFDSETGDVLLTKTQNEFEDAMYQFTYPAHWAYEGMEQAYQNIGALVTSPTGLPGGLLPSEFKPNFYPGDELVINRTASDIPLEGRYWISEPTTEGPYYVINDEGQLLNHTGESLTIKVIRSGRRNLAGVPIGKVVTRKNPISGNQLVIDDSASEALEASAITFGEDWLMRCQEMDNNQGSTINDGQTIINGGTYSTVTGYVVNPYTQGLKGCWRPTDTYVFYGERNPGDLSGHTHIQTDGLINEFEAFWQYSNGAWSPITSSVNWTRSNTINAYDQRGNEIENRDALGIFSAAAFGYNQNRVVAVASNAQFSEILFDGFEDYQYDNDCATVTPYRRVKLFSPAEETQGAYEIVEGIAHTGKHSLLIGPYTSGKINIFEECIVDDGMGTNNQPPDPCIWNLQPEYCKDFSYSFSACCTTDDFSQDNLNYHWLFLEPEGSVIADITTSGNIDYVTNISFPTADENYALRLTVTDEGGLSTTEIFNFNVVEDDCAQQLQGQSNNPCDDPQQFIAVRALVEECEPYSSVGNGTVTNNCCACLPMLKLQEKEYLVSLWYGNNNTLFNGSSFNPSFSPNLRISYTYNNNDYNIELQPVGPFIEGWQQYEAKINIPGDLENVTLSLENEDDGTYMYIDDIRIHPWLSNMQSYVYDYQSMRLMATLDDRNYATFYEYDDAGILTRIKRETEKGVMTVQESRTMLSPTEIE